MTHVSLYEADAYASWAGARLPTEFEWEAAAQAHDSPRRQPDGRRRAVEPRPAAGPAFFGDVWEWTGSAYRPYPGFRPVAGAVGEYNGKFMSGQFVLRGGSCATRAAMPAPATATSSTRTSAGSSPACGSPRICNAQAEVEDGEQSLADPQFRADVLAGLERRPRAIPARWFYDRRGSELF